MKPTLVTFYGEVSWKTPIKKDFKEVPVSEKACCWAQMLPPWRKEPIL
ncbi:MAG: hypothetical protein MJA30_13685 [Cytophagales bacterium]|nr:hypothetical protein [Cytophagales bacterium]